MTSELAEVRELSWQAQREWERTVKWTVILRGVEVFGPPSIHFVLAVGSFMLTLLNSVSLWANLGAIGLAGAALPSYKFWSERLSKEINNLRLVFRSRGKLRSSLILCRTLEDYQAWEADLKKAYDNMEPEGKTLPSGT